MAAVDGIKKVTRSANAATERATSGDAAAKGKEQADAAAGAGEVRRPSSRTPRGESALSQASEGQKETTPSRRRTVRSTGTSVAGATQADIDTKKSEGADTGDREARLDEARNQADLRIELAANDAQDGSLSPGGDEDDDERAYVDRRGLRTADQLDDTEKVIVAEQLEEERRQMRESTDELLTGRVPERTSPEDHPEVDFSGMGADERALLYQSVLNERALLDAERALISGHETGDHEWDANIDTSKVDIDGDPDNGPDVDDLDDEDIEAQQQLLETEQQYLWDLTEQVAGTFTDEEIDELRENGSFSVSLGGSHGTVRADVSEEWVDKLEDRRNDSDYRPETPVADLNAPEGAFGSTEYRASRAAESAEPIDPSEPASEIPIESLGDGMYAIGDADPVRIDPEDWSFESGYYGEVQVAINSPSVGPAFVTVQSSQVGVVVSQLDLGTAPPVDAGADGSEDAPGDTEPGDAAAGVIVPVDILENDTPEDWTDDTHVVSIDGQQVEIPESAFTPIDDSSGVGWVDGIPHAGGNGETYAAQIQYMVGEDSALSYEILATALQIPEGEATGSGADGAPEPEPAAETSEAPAAADGDGAYSPGSGGGGEAPVDSGSHASYDGGHDAGSAGGGSVAPSGGIGGDGAMAPAAEVELAPIGSGTPVEPLRIDPPLVAGGPGSTVFSVGGVEFSIADDAFAPQPGLDVAYAAVDVAGKTFIVVRHGAGTPEDPYTYEMLDADAMETTADIDAILELILAHEQERLLRVDDNLTTTRGTTGPDQAIAALGVNPPLQ